MHGEFQAREMRYWETLMERESGNPRSLWSSLSGILGRCTTPALFYILRPLFFFATVYMDYMCGKVASVRLSQEGLALPFLPSVVLPLTAEDHPRQSAESCELDTFPPFL